MGLAEMRVYLITDLEGVAGIVNFDDYCTPKSRYYDLAKRLLTEEVNAAAEGFFAAGADEVTVVDGHGPGAVAPELLSDARMRYERGLHTPIYPWGLDEGYDVFTIVGQHAKSGTPFSHITHTGSADCYDLWCNGYSIGEFGELALCARELGIPTIFASGEEAFCREAEDLAPGVVTAGVKRGLTDDKHERGIDAADYFRSKLAANHLCPQGACKLIREQAEAALRKYLAHPEAFAYRAFEAPYRLEREFRTNHAAGRHEICRQEASDAKSFIQALNALLNAPLVPKK